VEIDILSGVGQRALFCQRPNPCDRIKIALNVDIKYWVAFNNIPGIGRVRLGQLESCFGSLERAWQASPGELKRAGLDSQTLKTVAQWRDKIDPDAEMARLEKFNIKVLTSGDKAYPRRLREIYDFPPVLYMRGSILPEDDWCLAVVGTRRVTVYGKQVTEEMVADLARSKITIVSGLARGVDTIAHRSALEVGGRTIAVFACGLDTVYPAENERLARDIMENGALLSEYPPGTRPKAENFPRRNRILSGLSLGVLVTEAGEDSGAMITAHLALEQNREVFAIPGSILSLASRGTNNLIQEGAKLVRGHVDILEELNLTSVARQIEMREVLPESETEEVLLKQLSAEPSHIDEVCRKSGLSAATVSGTLAMMEFKGMVRQVGTMNYVLARELRPEYRVRVE
jgi:DNA processing protein